MSTFNKIKLYKDNISKYLENNNLKIIDIEEIDYIIGILFLTEMNRYCKINKINIHGYYIAFSIINLFNKIKKKLLSNASIDIDDINNYILYLSYNIDYLNSRVDSINPIKNIINNNFSKFIIEINHILLNLVKFNKKHKSKSVNNLNDNNKNNNDIDTTILNLSYNNIYCNNQCYICWIDNVLSKFFYLLLITAKFMGSGEVKKDPNLIKISEYYSNIIYTYIKLMNSENLSSDNYSNLFNNYIDNKNKLYYLLIELKINSDTFDEIIVFLDNIIINKLNINIK